VDHILHHAEEEDQYDDDFYDYDDGYYSDGEDIVY